MWWESTCRPTPSVVTPVTTPWTAQKMKLKKRNPPATQVSKHFSSRCVPESAGLRSLYVSVRPLSKGTKTTDKAGNQPRGETGWKTGEPNLTFGGCLRMKNEKSFALTSSCSRVGIKMHWITVGAHRFRLHTRQIFSSYSMVSSLSDGQCGANVEKESTREPKNSF